MADDELTMEERLKQSADALSAEGAEWEKMQIHPSMFPPDLMIIACQMDATFQLLVEKGILDADETTVRLREIMVETMQRLRKDITRQRIMQGKPKLVVPRKNGPLQ